MIRKIRHAVLALALCLGMLAGCGSGVSTDESTVFVKKDGSVISVDVEAFDPDTYDEKGLKEYVEQTISDYNSTNGKNQVRLKSLSVKDKKAKLTLQYASSADYRKLNGIDFFAGTMAEALAAGYTFDTEFASVKDGVAQEVCDTGEFINDSSYKAVIIRGNTNVQVKGKIAYVSTVNTRLLDGSTVSIREGNSLFGSSDTQNAENTEAVSTENNETETVTEAQATESEGAVSEDDLLEASNEEPEPVFQFDDDSESRQETGSEFSQVYTYIIYQ